MVKIWGCTCTGHTMNIAISTTLNQGERPAAFMSQTLKGSDLHYSIVEKEATAMMVFILIGWVSALNKHLKTQEGWKNYWHSSTGTEREK